jgi:ABC-type branched-subunit amino acid transport system ATPase component
MFEKLLLTNIKLASGRSPGNVAQALELNSLTVFVGPNNSGKSLALSEIHGYARLHAQGRTPKRKIVVGLTITPLTQDEAKRVAETFHYLATTDENVILAENEFMYAHRGGRSRVSNDQILGILQSPDARTDAFRQFYLNNVTINLGGESRITLTNKKPTGNLQWPDQFNSFQTLFADDVLRTRVRAILHRAFGKYFVLNPTDPGTLKIAFADRPPSSRSEEQGLHKEAREYFASTESIDDLSDGVKAYTGIVVEIVAGNPRIILIDEPEAFLHPPLAHKLGAEISRIAAEAHKNVFVSTHSADFVMGCLQSGTNVDIVRLTYKNGLATARVLKNSELVQMMRSPLLRSTGVINALFYESVVVTEGDADRAFYQEVNERMLKVGRGIPNCLFLNAQNKQTTKLITKPLRELGIPTISIVDIDVVKDGGSVWSSFLESAYMPPLDIESSATARLGVLSRLTAADPNFKTNGGIEVLSKEDTEAANNLFNRLEEYGLFVVRKGELESWLKQFGIPTGNKTRWLIETFNRLGDDPTKSDYVGPSNDDVWEFLDRIGKWFLNSTRKGIPD